jgi:hypothetical protein
LEKVHGDISMAQYTQELFKPGNFSLAFEQMCNFAAIAKTRNADETLGQIILQCFVVFPKEKFQNAEQLAEAITIFGLKIPEYQVQVSLDHLIANSRLQQTADSILTLPNRDRTQLKERIDEAKALEERVKRAWLENISTRFPSLSSDQVWKGLQGYLARTFRCHGLQAAALLDNSLDIAPAYSESLFSLLNESLKEIFSPELRAPARDAILSFFVELENHPEQGTYIEQLEDGVFHYFSLIVDPEVAVRLQKKLNQLTLFLDTNFLFDILGIHEKTYYVEISNQLLDTINTHKLPFKLRFHQATAREMRTAIAYHGSELRTQQRTQEYSTAANYSPLSYPLKIDPEHHRRNGAIPIDADSFLKRYEHVDILLKDKNIFVHRSQLERRRERAELLEKYQQFLSSRGRMKPYETMNHDISVLDAVHQMRSKAKSSLEAGALFITRDTLLYMFDWMTSQQQDRVACAVLPDIFLQVLRPFVSSSADFDRSFEETFVIPEFRAIESKSSEARAKMLSYLTAYETLPEETASQLLSNDLLLEPLRPTENEQFHEYLESALQGQNASLLEEKAAMEKQFERELAEKEGLEKRLEQERIEREKEKARADKAEQILRRKEKELTSPKLKQKEGVGQNLEEIDRERQAREEAENRAKEEASARAKAERKAEIYSITVTITVSLFLVSLVQSLIYLLKLSHPHGTGLQIAFDALLILFTVGSFQPKCRKWCWGAGAFAILIVIIQLLG